MPAAIYLYLRTAEHKPIVVGDGALIPSDRQLQDHLLCQECEDILNDGGETWVIDKLARIEKTFPLYDLITAAPPAHELERTRIYYASNTPEVKVDKLVHFGMGLFWKAAVHSWKGGEASPRIELGKYAEPLRTWLRGESAFPAHMYLIVGIAPPESAQMIMFPPYEGEKSGWHVFFTYVPGILFMLNVGRTVDEPRQWLCTWNNSDHPITISEGLLNNLKKASESSFRGARQTNSFFRAMDKIAEEKGEKFSSRQRRNNPDDL